MKRPKRYPGALVPEFLTTFTIEGLKTDKPVFIYPGNADDDESPPLFVTSDRKLRIDKNHIIDGDDAYPEGTQERVGIMKTLIPDPTNGFKEVYVADLRFVDNHQIVDIANASSFGNDQEAYVDWLGMVEDSIEFDAFIAPEFNDELDVEEDVPGGVFYGNEQLYPALRILRKKSNRITKRYMERETRRIEMMKAAEQDEPEEAVEEPEISDQVKVNTDKPKTLEIKFSHGNQ